MTARTARTANLDGSSEATIKPIVSLLKRFRDYIVASMYNGTLLAGDQLLRIEIP